MLRNSNSFKIRCIGKSRPDLGIVFGKSVSKRMRIREKIIQIFFSLNGIAASAFIILIFYFLFKEGLHAFEYINISDFIYSEKLLPDGSYEKVFEWFPTSEDARFSVLPLLLGTLMTAIPATIISTLLGVTAGIYLSEMANHKTKVLLKPVIELFAGIPTVVLGFLLLAAGATFFDEIFNPANRLNAFLASIGLSFIVIPIIATLTEDALDSIPTELRMASYGLGATKWQTIWRVILPAASSGISASIILGFGRAIGETMIVLMASGNAANTTFNLFKSVRTLTATIAAELGEVSQGSEHYFALFFIGIVLFSITFLLNLVAELIINKMRKKNKLL